MHTEEIYSVFQRIDLSLFVQLKPSFTIQFSEISKEPFQIRLVVMNDIAIIHISTVVFAPLLVFDVVINGVCILNRKDLA